MMDSKYKRLYDALGTMETLLCKMSEYGESKYDRSDFLTNLQVVNSECIDLFLDVKNKKNK